MGIIEDKQELQMDISELLQKFEEENKEHIVCDICIDRGILPLVIVDIGVRNG